MNNTLQVCYRINEDHQFNSWQDVLTRNHHAIINNRYRPRTRATRPGFNLILKKTKRNKRLIAKKKDKSIILIDFYLRDYKW